MERQTSGFKLALGDKAPYFSLRGTDGKIHNISDYREHCLVVLFMCNHCPYSKAYEVRVCEIAERYQPLGARFVAVCSNDAMSFPEDGFDRMVEKSKELNLPYPYLHDDTQIVAQAYDAACTPEAYVFDQGHRLQYHGRIDDQHEDSKKVQHHYLADAIEAVLAGEKPAIPLTSAIGCSIKWKVT